MLLLILCSGFKKEMSCKSSVFYLLFLFYFGFKKVTIRNKMSIDVVDLMTVINVHCNFFLNKYDKHSIVKGVYMS